MNLMIFILMILRRLNLKKSPQVIMSLRRYFLLHLMEMRESKIPSLLHIKARVWYVVVLSKFLSYAMHSLMIWKVTNL
jgi:hypothetical protein